MKREIKFKVWDGQDYMSQPFTLQDLMLGKIQFTSDCPVLQFTGLKDKSGKEIYEGDIIKHDDGHICLIKFEKGGFQMEYMNKHMQGTTRRISFSAQYCEITGNIYANPQLIKK